jgi:hypothetical protein
MNDLEVETLNKYVNSCLELFCPRCSRNINLAYSSGVIHDYVLCTQCFQRILHLYYCPRKDDECRGKIVITKQGIPVNRRYCNSCSRNPNSEPELNKLYFHVPNEAFSVPHVNVYLNDYTKNVMLYCGHLLCDDCKTYKNLKLNHSPNVIPHVKRMFCKICLARVLQIIKPICAVKNCNRVLPYPKWPENYCGKCDTSHMPLITFGNTKYKAPVIERVSSCVKIMSIDYENGDVFIKKLKEDDTSFEHVMDKYIHRGRIFMSGFMIN